jgi:hypothetical protein
MPNLTCPNCQKNLKTTAAVAPGTKVRCPSCGQTFEAAGGAEETGIQAPPRREVVAPTAIQSEPPTPRPARRQPRADAERRPRRLMGPIVVSVVVAVLVLALIAGLLAFVWPGFLRRTAPPNINDPFAFLPVDSNFILGANLSTLRAQGKLDAALAILRAPPQVGPLQGIPPELEGIVRDGDLLLAADKMREGEDPRPVFILRTQRPVDVEKVKAACGAVPSLPLHGFTVFRADPGNRGGSAWLAIPGDHLVVLSGQKDHEFGDLLGAAQKKGAAHPALELIRQVEAAPGWGVVPFDASVKKKIQAAIPNMPAQGGDPGLGPMLQKARGATLTLEWIDPPALKAKLRVLCNDNDDAAKIAEAAKQLWGPIKAFAPFVVVGKVQDPAQRALVIEAIRTLAFQQDGDAAVATLQLSEKALQQLI